MRAAGCRSSQLGPAAAAACVLLAFPALASADEVQAGAQPLGARLPLVSLIPFAALLASIAICPLTAGHWWEHNRNKGVIAAIFTLPLAIYLAVGFGEDGVEKLQHAGMEYVSFIALTAALFVVTGGIYVQGSLSGTPLVNTGLLGFGALIASFIGTTGASMLLIRPLLRANAPRQRKAHIVVFFIFIVSNCGGLLTPMGDPPLFLGFLKGVPFEWTFRLWKEWLVVNIALLAIFNIWDQTVFAREEKERPGSQLEEVQRHEPLRIQGLANLVLLAGIVAGVYAAGRGLGNGGEVWPFGVAQGLTALLAATSYLMTPKAIHEKNRFGFGPINEVAILFAGIFVTMIPALEILNHNGKDVGLSQPWQFFWVTGALSSVLDNAPTYLTFAATACGIHGVPLEGRYLAAFLKLPEKDTVEHILAAISCGAVFMGANTYIGNGPNFMVKAIAEAEGVRMPSFFGYMAYAGVVLIPIFVVVTFLFFA